MLAQGETLRAIILHDFTPCVIGARRDVRFDRFRAEVAASRSSAAAKSGSGTSPSPLIFQSASRRLRPREPKASASARRSRAATVQPARRQRSSIDAKGVSPRMSAIAAPSALDKPLGHAQAEAHGEAILAFGSLPACSPIGNG